MLTVIASLAVEGATAQFAELVWVDRTPQENSIHLSSFDGSSWSPIAEPLFKTSNSVTAAKIGTDSLGNKLLIWTEQIRDKTVLMHATRQLNKKWSKAEVLFASGNENYAGSIVFDQNDVAWVFWSSADEGLADIYYLNIVDDQLSSVQELHSQNQVPDTHPQANLMQNGDIKVEWVSYSLEKGQTIQRSKVLATGSKGKQKLDIDNDLDIESLPLPSYLPQNSLSLLHVPNNKMQQSIMVSQEHRKKK